MDSGRCQPVQVPLRAGVAGDEPEGLRVGRRERDAKGGPAAAGEFPLHGLEDEPATVGRLAVDLGDDVLRKRDTHPGGAHGGSFV